MEENEYIVVFMLDWVKFGYFFFFNKCRLKDFFYVKNNNISFSNMK